METDKLGKYHKECFKCITCTKSLVGVPWKAEKTEAFCAECHVQAFAPECAGCGEKIAGAGVTVNGTPYHKECKPVASGGAVMRHGPTPPRGKGAAAPVKTSTAGAKAKVGGIIQGIIGEYGALG